jgi:c-di-GMP-binding flagellar brake protein YcgR
MQLLGQVIQSFKSETNELRYDQRVQFREISRDVQDEIIKYIFEEQRKLRRKEQR